MGADTWHISAGADAVHAMGADSAGTAVLGTDAVGADTVSVSVPGTASGTDVVGAGVAGADMIVTAGADMPGTNAGRVRLVVRSVDADLEGVDVRDTEAGFEGQ